MKQFVKQFLRLLLVSFCFIVIIAALSIVYGFIAHRVFTLRYIFSANMAAGALLIGIGVVMMFLPTAWVLRGQKLLDHSNFVEKTRDHREGRQQKARMVLWLGIICTVLTGLIQLLLSFVIV